MSDTPQYPDRPQFFAHRFCRLLTRAAVAQQIGPEACWLLAVVAHQEDTVHYRRAVTYYNEQLMPLCGFGGRSRLVEARRKAVEHGWLHYEAGGKGKPGIYWVEVPEAYQDVPDGPCDADSDEVSRPISGRQPDGNSPNAVPNQDGNRTATGRQPDGKPAPSNPSPNPSPSPKRVRARKAASPFVKPTLEEVAEYCRERKNGIDAEKFIAHYDTIGWVYGRNRTPMKDWKAAVITWEKNDYEKGHSSGHGNHKTNGHRLGRIEAPAGKYDQFG